jgi:hypothetical protein
MALRGPIFQVCWVVEELAPAREWFSERHGVERWLTIADVHFPPETCMFRGQPGDYTIDVSIAYAGSQQVELIMPVSGRNIYIEHLESRGPGVQHLAYIPDDFDQAILDAAAAGLEVPQLGRMTEVGMDFAYIEGGPLGTYVEIMRLSDTMHDLFDSLLPEGYHNPWHP